MFALKQPCSNCPFRRGVGETFRLAPDRLEEIRRGAAFQCHRTIDYSEWDDPHKRQGDKPQQCAGLMAVLARENQMSTIMQVAYRWGVLDPTTLDPKREAYESWQEVLQAHSGERA